MPSRSTVRALVGAAAAITLTSPAIAFPHWIRAAAATNLTTGQLAPGLGPGVRFSSFRPSVSVNRHGEVAFLGDVTGTGITQSNSRGIWSSAGGSLNSLARLGGPVPEISPTASFGFMGGQNITDTGETVFQTQINGLGGTQLNRAIWVAGRSGGTSLHALSGTVPDGAPGGATFGPLTERPLATNTGVVGFSSSLRGSNPFPTNAGFWVGEPGAPGLGVLVGTQAAGLQSGLVYGSFGSTPLMNDLGEVAFTTFAFDPSGTIPDSVGGVWVASASGDQLRVRDGTAAPGASDGAQFSQFFAPRVNNRGDLVFWSRLAGSATPEARDGIYVQDAAGMHKVARLGEQVPGAPFGATWSNLDQAPVIGSDGQVLFRAAISLPAGGDQVGVWVWRDGVTEAFASNGMAAPDMTPGLTLTDVTRPENAAINANGQIALYAALQAEGQSSGALGNGIWATDLDGVIRKVVATGDLLELAGTLREVQSVTFLGGSGGEDGLATGFSDGGHVAFTALFTDGTEAVMVALVPAPGAGAVAAIAAGAWLRRRRRC